jgi:hypothetical protein
MTDDEKAFMKRKQRVLDLVKTFEMSVSAGSVNLGSEASIHLTHHDFNERRCVESYMCSQVPATAPLAARMEILSESVDHVFLHTDFVAESGGACERMVLYESPVCNSEAAVEKMIEYLKLFPSSFAPPSSAKRDDDSSVPMKLKMKTSSESSSSFRELARELGLQALQQEREGGSSCRGKIIDSAATVAAWTRRALQHEAKAWP